MKISRLLGLGALWLMSLGALAQSFTASWTIPVPAGVDSYEYSTFAEENGDTIAYYLYNVGVGAFFTEGNAWGTQASVGETGLKVAVAKYTIADEWDGKTVFIWDYSLAKNAWKRLFIDSETQAYVDLNTQLNYFWEIEAQGNNRFRIKGADANPDFNSAYYASGDGSAWFGMSTTPDPATAITPLIDLEVDPGASVDWMFLTEEGYETFQPSVAVYYAAQKLKEQIEWALEQGVKASDLADEFAVYNNTSSTLEQLQAASKSAYSKGRFAEIAPYFENIVQGEKNDVSGVLTNNDFSDGTANGWDITYKASSTEATNIGYQSNKSYSNGDVVISQFIEAWKNTSAPAWLGDGSITQTIPSLPAGKYTLAVDVIANNQGRIKDDNNPDGLPDDVELFAEASEDGKTYKTNMATRNGLPEHFEFTFVHTGGDMTMGLRVVNSAEAKMPANWIAMDNLELYYYGEVVDDPDKVMLDQVIDDALKVYPLEELDYLIAYVGDKDAFKAAIEEAKAATENYLDYIDKVNVAKSALDKSVEAYKTFAKKVEVWNQYVVDYDFDSDAWGSFCDFVGDMEVPAEDGYPELTPTAVLEEMTLSVEEINAYIEQVEALFKKAFSESLVDGADVTNLITNADLMDGKNGWTTSYEGSGNFQAGGYNSYKVFEAWHAKNFNFSQQLTNLPVGVYELSTQGFVRYLDGQEALTNRDQCPEFINICIYMNNSATYLPNWLDYPQEPGFFDTFNEEELTAKGDNSEKASYVTDEQGYEYTNNRTGAAACFAKGDFTVRAFGLVENEGDVFTVGIKGENLEQVFWPLWGQFKLTYRAFNPEVVREALETALTTIDTSQPMAKSLFGQASELNEKAQALLSGEDGKAMFDLLKEIYALTATISESVQLFSRLYNAADELSEIAASSESAKKTEAIALANEIYGHIENRDIENEEAEVYLQKIAKMKTVLRLPDGYEQATDENPVDVTVIMETPSFEKDDTNSIDGWTATGQKFGNSDQLSALALESWESVLHIYQDIIGLPDGIYTLKVNAWERTGTPAYLYATSGDQTFSKELINMEEGLPEGMSAPTGLIEAVSMFDDETFMNEVVLKVTGEEVRVGIRKDETTSGDWIVMDNFQLWYHGANSGLTPDGDAQQQGIESASSVPVAKVEFFTLDGRRVTLAQRGLFIMKMTAADGTVVVRKVRR